MKKLLFALLLMASTAEAQTIGCFYDFNSQSCDGAGNGIVEYYPFGGSYQDNVSRYGRVMADAIFAYFGVWKEAEAEVLLQEHEIATLKIKIKRLRRRIRRLKR